MTDKELAEIVVRSLLAIASGISKRYNLPTEKKIAERMPREVYGEGESIVYAGKPLQERTNLNE